MARRPSGATGVRRSTSARRGTTSEPRTRMAYSGRSNAEEASSTSRERPKRSCGSARTTQSFPSSSTQAYAGYSCPPPGVESWMEKGLIDAERIFTSAAGVFSGAVAEHALALMLAGARRLHECARATSWEEAGWGRLFGGSTVVILGAGGIGRALIRLLEPFGARVLAVTRSGREVPGATESYSADRTGELWPEGDFFVVAAPATGATEKMIGARELGAMQDHAWVVNVARGSLIDTNALVEALAEERIGGAALDVTDPEPLPDGHPLWTEPRALITPHTAKPPA